MARFDRRKFLVGATALGGTLAYSRAPALAQSLIPTSLVLGPPDTASILPPVAKEGGFTKQEGLDLKIVTTDGGVQTRQVLAAGQTEFAIGDTAHPLQLSNRGKACRIMFATANFPTVAHMVVRADLYEQGITTPEKFAAWKRPNGAKPIIAATQIGASTWTYGSWIFEQLHLDDKINWVSGGSAQGLLGGLSSKQFDAIMCQPAWMFTALDKGWGKLIYDPRNAADYKRIFGGPLPVGAVVYAELSTIKAKHDVTQRLINACYRGAQWMKNATVDQIYDLIGEKYLGHSDPDIIKRELAYYADKKTQILNYDGTITADEYERASPIWFREGTGIEKIPFEEAFDLTFAQEAKKKIG